MELLSAASTLPSRRYSSFIQSTLIHFSAAIEAAVVELTKYWIPDSLSLSLSLLLSISLFLSFSLDMTDPTSFVRYSFK